MSFFIGEFEYTIDNKGRVNIPAKFRKNLSPEARETFIIMQGKGGCLDVYPLDVFQQKIFSKIDQMSHSDDAERYYVSVTGANSSDSQLDSQGRIAISQKLLNYAGITKDILIIGAFNRVEMWNPERRAAYLENMKNADGEINKELLP
ncbi:division/cell wall cluster transcriptional repressor MraZ [candidate division KSB1 bacterium]|nr:division/cell wall cluster transcriptional repressor MraZ [candidate division KSB1 bacterium]